MYRSTSPSLLVKRRSPSALVGLLALSLSVIAHVSAQPLAPLAPAPAPNGSSPDASKSAPSSASAQAEGSNSKEDTARTQPANTAQSLKQTPELTPEQKSSAASQGSGEGPTIERRVTSERAKDSERVPVRRRAPSRLGATGLAEVLSADPGPQGTVRMSLHFGGFSSSEFLTPGFEERFLSSRASVAYTPHELTELYLSARSLSHTSPLSSPSTLQSQGDVNLGAKLGRFWGAVGAGLAIDALLYSAPSGGWDLSATNLNLHGLFTLDLTRREAPVPFRFLFDLQFTKERSEALFSDLPELPSTVQEWAYQAGFYDHLHLRFGLEAPTEHVSPFVEYNIGTPFLVEMPRMGRFSNVFAFESVPHSLNAGLRGFWKERVSVELVGSLGLSDAPFTGVLATPPWQLWAGVSYTLDPRPEVIEREVEVKVTPPTPKAPEPKPLGALLSLSILNKDNKAPIPGARVRFLKLNSVAPQLSDEQGRITGYRFEPQRLEIEVSAEGYLTRRLALTIKGDKEELKGKLSLTPDPALKPSFLEVQLIASKSAEGVEEPLPEGLSAQPFELELHGPQHHRATLSFGAEAQRLTLKPGEYALSLSASGELRYQSKLSVGAGGEVKRLISPQDLLGAPQAQPQEPSKKAAKAKRKRTPRASKPRARKRSRGASRGASSGGGWAKIDLKRKTLTPKKKLSFNGDSATLSAQSLKVITGFTQQLLKERKVKGVTISMHTHNVGGAEESKRLGQARGEAIRAQMAKAGFSTSNIKVVSYGSSQNIAPNITSSGRARNQRALFTLSLKE